MQLTEILEPNNDFDTVICYNRSSEYFQVMLNLIKKRYGIRTSDTFYLTSLSELQRHEELLATRPLMSPCWLFYIEDTNQLPSADLLEIVRKAESLMLVIGTSNYGRFLSLKSNGYLKKRTLVTFYGSALSKGEFEMLLRASIKAKGAFKPTVKINELVVKGYLREPDSVFKFLSAIKAGIRITSRKELIDLLGVGSLSVERLTLNLLKANPLSVKGLNMSSSRSLQRFTLLAQRTSWGRLHRSILDTLVAMLDLKMLMAKGILVAGVPAKLRLEKYSNHHANKLSFMIEDIEQIPLKKIVYALTLVNEGTWSSELDLFYFIHRYYYGKAKEILTES